MTKPEKLLLLIACVCIIIVIAFSTSEAQGIKIPLSLRLIIVTLGIGILLLCAADALTSDFMKTGRKWQREYGLDNWKKPKNRLMPCLIRDHYEIFRNSVPPKRQNPKT